MKIAVNTRLLLKGRLEGIGWFAYETLKRITQNHPEHSFLFLFDRSFDPGFIFGNNVEGLVVPPPARHPLLWYTWFEYAVPRALKRHQADIFFSPDGYMPLHLKIPSLIAIHDINFHHRPQDLPWSSSVYYRRNFPRFARKANRIVTVSEYSRQDISSNYGIDPEKIDIVYNGANDILKPLPAGQVEQTRQSLTGGAPYFFFVGSMHPRKNLPRLLKAFDLFRKGMDHEFKLVIAGEKMFMTSEMDKALREMRFRKEVIFTGRLSPEELNQILGSSSGLTFVPLFEGFGIPLLEAMQCDIPILTSNVTSLPEIAGEAAIYTDPHNIQSIVDGMKSLAGDAGLRKKLIDEGRKRRTSFSWDETARRLWSSMEKILE